jgi:hypothetical protein
MGNERSIIDAESGGNLRKTGNQLAKESGGLAEAAGQAHWRSVALEYRCLGNGVYLSKAVLMVKF